MEKKEKLHNNARMDTQKNFLTPKIYTKTREKDPQRTFSILSFRYTFIFITFLYGIFFIFIYSSQHRSTEKNNTESGKRHKGKKGNFPNHFPLTLSWKRKRQSHFFAHRNIFTSTQNYPSKIKRLYIQIYVDSVIQQYQSRNYNFRRLYHKN